MLALQIIILIIVLVNLILCSFFFRKITLLNYENKRSLEYLKYNIYNFFEEEKEDLELEGVNYYGI